MNFPPSSSFPQQGAPFQPPQQNQLPGGAPRPVQGGFPQNPVPVSNFQSGAPAPNASSLFPARPTNLSTNPPQSSFGQPASFAPGPTPFVPPGAPAQNNQFGRPVGLPANTTATSVAAPGVVLTPAQGTPFQQGASFGQGMNKPPAAPFGTPQTGAGARPTPAPFGAPSNIVAPPSSVTQPKPTLNSPFGAPTTPVAGFAPTTAKPSDSSAIPQNPVAKPNLNPPAPVATSAPFGQKPSFGQTVPVSQPPVAANPAPVSSGVTSMPLNAFTSGPPTSFGSPSNIPGSQPAPNATSNTSSPQQPSNAQAVGVSGPKPIAPGPPGSRPFSTPSAGLPVASGPGLVPQSAAPNATAPFQRPPIANPMGSMPPGPTGPNQPPTKPTGSVPPVGANPAFPRPGALPTNPSGGQPLSAISQPPVGGGTFKPPTQPTFGAPVTPPVGAPTAFPGPGGSAQVKSPFGVPPTNAVAQGPPTGFSAQSTNPPFPGGSSAPQQSGPPTGFPGPSRTVGGPPGPGPMNVPAYQQGPPTGNFPPSSQMAPPGAQGPPGSFPPGPPTNFPGSQPGYQQQPPMGNTMAGMMGPPSMMNQPNFQQSPMGTQGMPGQNMGAPGYPSTPQPSNPLASTPTNSSQNRGRVDPNVVPRPPYSSPANAVKFMTSSIGVTAIPSAWSDFVADDTGSASPRFLRPTLAHVPASPSLLRDSKVPLAMAVTPLARPHVERGEKPVQLVDFGPNEPVRCGRCNAYVNPFVAWSVVDGGRSWKCNLCDKENETPEFYVPPGGTDASGVRYDNHSRPELMYGSVDLVAPPSYITRPQMSQTIAFAVDVSLSAVTAGVLAAAVASIRASLPGIESRSEGRARVGVFVYDSEITFFDIAPTSSRQERPGFAEAIMGDTEEPFCPLALDQWAPELRHGRANLEALLDALPTRFAPTVGRPVGSCAGSAAMAAVDGLEHAGGRVVLFEHSAPTHGLGKVASREVRSQYGSDKERLMYNAASGVPGQFYGDLAKRAAANGVSFDILVCSAPGVSVDLPTQIVLTTLTGGFAQIYPFFVPPKQGPTPSQPAVVQPPPLDLLQRVAAETAARLAREQGTAAILKVRASLGLSVAKYIGSFYDKVDSEADIALVDADSCVMVELAHESGSVADGAHLYVQAAMHYTSACGQRRVRVHTQRLTGSEVLGNVFRLADADSVLSFLSRKAISTIIAKDARSVAKSLSDDTVDMLHAYRAFCAVNSRAGQLILPESLKFMPLYVSSLLKLAAFFPNRTPSQQPNTHQQGLLGPITPQFLSQLLAPRGSLPSVGPAAALSDVLVRADARVCELALLSALPPAKLVPHIYPRVYKLGSLSDSHGVPLEPPYPGPDGHLITPPPPAPVHPSRLTPEQFDLVVLPPHTYPSEPQISPLSSYLIEHFSGLYLIIGNQMDEDLFREWFGDALPGPSHLQPCTKLPQLHTDGSLRLWTIIETIRRRRGDTYLDVVVIGGSDDIGKRFLSSLLVEDKIEPAFSYVDLLCQFHANIQERLKNQ